MKVRVKKIECGFDGDIELLVNAWLTEHVNRRDDGKTVSLVGPVQFVQAYNKGSRDGSSYPSLCAVITYTEA